MKRTASSPQQTSSWGPGTPPRIGRFEISGELGRGGFGIAYRARDPDLSRDVVIKVPLLASEESIKRFLFEAQTVARLNHRGIVIVHELGRILSSPPIPDGTPFSVMEYFKSGSLQELLVHQRLKHGFTVELLAAVTDTIHEIHGQGIIHRDLKPENILLDSGMKPYVCDFGLAVQEELQFVGSSFGGTLPYMSPEQVLCERLDPRTDVWSLGVILYRMLTGTLPFQGKGEMILAEILEESPKPPRQYDQDIPDFLEGVCLRCLEKRPSSRFTTAADLAKALRGASDPQPLERLGIRFIPVFRKPIESLLHHSQVFYMSETLVSESDWSRIGKQQSAGPLSPDRAKTNVSYSQVQDFLSAANSQLKDAHLDLPTVEQWLFAVRCGGVWATPHLNSPVLRRGKPSDVALHDLFGVAWQFCSKANRFELRGGGYKTRFSDPSAEPEPLIAIPTMTACDDYGLRLVLRFIRE